MKPRIIDTLHYEDHRGYNAILYDDSIKSKLPGEFKIVQFNQGFSVHPYTLRGLHYQLPPYEKAKLCYCLSGQVYNVSIELETGEIVTALLKPGMAMYIPRGYAHGCLTLELNTLFKWCVDNNYAQEAARVIRFDSCGIDWPVKDWNEVIISDKDKVALAFSEMFCEN